MCVCVCVCVCVVLETTVSGQVPMMDEKGGKQSQDLQEEGRWN